MSGRNGNRSRFHRDRKKKIARRQRNRSMLKSLTKQGNQAADSSGPKPKAATV